MRDASDAFIKFAPRLVSALLAILFVLTTVLVLLLFNVERTLLNAGTYKNILARNGVYQQFPTLARGELGAIKTFLTNQAGIPSKNLDFMNNLTTDDWQTLLNRMLPPDEAKEMVDSLLDQVFAAIAGETNAAHLSLVTLKTHLTGQAGLESIHYLLNIQPHCSEEQVVQIHLKSAGKTGQLVYCNPPQQDLAPLTSQWQTQLDSSAAGIPDEVSFVPLSGLPLERMLGKNPIARLNMVRLVIELSPILPLILLLLLTLFAVRSLKGWLCWWGFTFFIAGHIILAIDLATLPLLNAAWVNTILPQFPSAFSADLTSLAYNLLVSVERVLVTPIMNEAAIIGLLGSVGIIVSLFVDAKPKASMIWVSQDAK